MQYILRQATAKDLDFFDTIYTTNMKAYVEKNYPWNPNLFRECFNPQDYRAIVTEDRIVGFVKVIVLNGNIYLGEIQVTTDFQRKGIGTSLIKSICQQAKRNQVKIWLRVLKGNPAKRLYQRLGFTTTEETNTHEIMENNLRS